MNNYYSNAKYEKHILKNNLFEQLNKTKTDIEVLIQYINNGVINEYFNIALLNSILSSNYELKKSKINLGIKNFESEFFYIYSDGKKISKYDILEKLKNKLINIESEIQILNNNYFQKEDVRLSINAFEYYFKLRIDNILELNIKLFKIFEKYKNYNNLEQKGVKNEINLVLDGLINVMGKQKLCIYLEGLLNKKIFKISDILKNYIFDYLK